MDLLAFIMALKAQGMTAAQITAAVNEYLQDHPDALDQAAVEAILDGRLDVIDNELSSVKSALKVLEPAASTSDVGKTLIAKTVSGGKVTAYEFGTARGGGLTTEIKSALLACFQHVAWAGDDGQDYYDALDAALNPPATLASISAVYTQSGAVYTADSLDSLKPDLVVTATYDDSTTAVVTAYTLSGTLTAGISTITVSYGGKTDAFTVSVTEIKYSYNLSDLVVLNSGVTPSTGFPMPHKTSGEIILNTVDGSRRRGFATEMVAPRCMMTTSSTNPAPEDLTETNYYPIPIPADATGVTVAITPSTQYLSVRAYTYTEQNHYTVGMSVGWVEGTATMTFNAGAYQYLSILSKYNSSGSSYPDEPTALTVTFTTT